MLYLDLTQVSVGTTINYDATVIFKGESQRIVDNATVVYINTESEYGITFKERPGFLIERKITNLGDVRDQETDPDNEAFIILDTVLNGDRSTQVITTMYMMNAGDNFNPFNVKLVHNNIVYLVNTKETLIESL